MPKRLLTAALVAMSLFITACDHDDDDDDNADTDNGASPPATETLSMDFTGLEDLGADQVYEGWLIVDGMPVSTGTFTVDAMGEPVPATSTVAADDAARATAFVLTLEPAVDPDPAPSAVHILAGDFAGDTAALTTDHADAIGTDFSSSAGTFILATPTTMADTTDEDQGIWFLDPSGGGPSASLTLPTLPAGWRYEGWVVVGGTPVSTGTFTDVAAVDSDGAGASAGPDGAPPFPGQDFISPAMVLTGGTAVISVEPDPDNSPAPFAIKPLVGSIGSPGGSQALMQNLGTVPSGTVSFATLAPDAAG